jgi:hypothetical protein
MLPSGLCAMIRAMEWQKFFSPDRDTDHHTDLDESAEAMGDDQTNQILSALRVLGLATVALGVLSLGLYAGRELRVRYKFKRRTPSDFFSRAGDLNTGTEYGMGV